MFLFLGGFVVGFIISLVMFCHNDRLPGSEKDFVIENGVITNLKKPKSPQPGPR
jgi:hypothetical protein